MSLGFTDALTLLKTEDTELLLVAQVVAERAREAQDEQFRRLARHIAAAVGTLFGGDS